MNNENKYNDEDIIEFLNDENDDENDIYDISEIFNSENEDEDEEILIKDVNNPYYEWQKALKEIYISHKTNSY